MTDTLQLLIEALPSFGLEAEIYHDTKVQIQGNYTVEIENPTLFKLLWNHQVIGPFDDLTEMLTFIQMDLQLNGEN